MRLQTVMKTIFLFKALEAEQETDVLNAMFERKVQPGEHIIDQGNDGDNFYVIDRCEGVGASGGRGLDWWWSCGAGGVVQGEGRRGQKCEIQGMLAGCLCQTLPQYIHIDCCNAVLLYNRSWYLCGSMVVYLSDWDLWGERRGCRWSRCVFRSDRSIPAGEEMLCMREAICDPVVGMCVTAPLTV